MYCLFFPEAEIQFTVCLFSEHPIITQSQKLCQILITWHYCPKSLLHSHAQLRDNAPQIHTSEFLLYKILFYFMLNCS